MEPALRELLAMREREGAAMAADLARRGQTIARALEAIERRARKRWRNTTRNCASAYPRCWKRPWDEERLAAEVALMADRSDISEEIARLKSHIAQLGELLAAAEPVGRKLDFPGAGIQPGSEHDFLQIAGHPHHPRRARDEERD